MNRVTNCHLVGAALFAALMTAGFVIGYLETKQVLQFLWEVIS